MLLQVCGEPVLQLSALLGRLLRADKRRRTGELLPGSSARFVPRFGMDAHLQESRSLLVFVLQRRELVAEPARRIIEALRQLCCTRCVREEGSVLGKRLARARAVSRVALGDRVRRSSRASPTRLIIIVQILHGRHLRSRGARPSGWLAEAKRGTGLVIESGAVVVIALLVLANEAALAVPFLLGAVAALGRRAALEWDKLGSSWTGQTTPAGLLGQASRSLAFCPRLADILGIWHWPLLRKRPNARRRPYRGQGWDAWSGPARGACTCTCTCACACATCACACACHVHVHVQHVHVHVHVHVCMR